MCSLSSQTTATCFTAHPESASLPLERKKKNNQPPETKHHQCHAGSKAVSSSWRLTVGPGLLLGILLLSLLGTIFTGLLLLFATLVLFVLVTPMTLPLLALMLLAVVGNKGEKKVTSEPASTQLCHRRDPNALTPRHAWGRSALIYKKQEADQKCWGHHGASERLHRVYLGRSDIACGWTKGRLCKPLEVAALHHTLHQHTA